MDIRWMDLESVGQNGDGLQISGLESSGSYKGLSSGYREVTDGECVSLLSTVAKQQKAAGIAD